MRWMSRSRKLILGGAWIGLCLALPLAAPSSSMGFEVMGVVGGIAPYPAPEPSKVYVSDYSTYTGWATVDYHLEPGEAICLSLSCGTQVSAYRWTGREWQTLQRRTGTRVWVAPFATVWSWTWSSSTGWLAMRDRNLLVRTQSYTF